MKPSKTQPLIVPVLSPGRHRSPRSGACFMEFASYLAGERWSDHPSCTHPALAHLARGVNDVVGDDARSRLTTLIPSVIGLNADDNRIDMVVAVHAGAAALPVASETRQRTLAVGLLHCLAILSKADDAFARSLSPIILDSLSRAPIAVAWAHRFQARGGFRGRADLEIVVSTMTSVAVIGIAEACIHDPDSILVRVLDETITHVATVIEPETANDTADESAVSRTSAPAFETV